MNLNFDFPFEVRTLFDDLRQCAKCGRNGLDCGGLELHHNWGRVSDSAFNASVLCKGCHDRITGTQEERLYLFGVTYRFLMIYKDDNIVRPFRPGPKEDAFIKAQWADLQHFDFSTD